MHFSFICKQYGQQEILAQLANSLGEISSSLVDSDTTHTEPEVLSKPSQRTWSQGEPEIGIELGIFTFLGTDIHITYREKESPWLFGYRYGS